MRDLVYAIRNLRRTPGFTLTAVATLALGIGATISIFAVVDGVLLKPYPMPDTDRLVFLKAIRRDENPLSAADFRDFQQQTNSFVSMGAVRGQTGLDLVGHGEPLRLTGATVSKNFFATLAIQPELGRFFNQDDFAARANVVLLTDGVWRDLFGADPSVIGRSIRMSDRLYTVIGIVPADLGFLSSTQVWLPGAMDEEGDRGTHEFTVIARLKPNVSVTEAGAEVKRIAKQLEAAYPADNTSWTEILVPFADAVSKNSSPTLKILMACVAVLLLIACANVTNLLLARGTSRRHEIAIRTALGATRVRLVSQFLTESLIISLAATALGLTLAQWGVRLLVALFPEGVVPRMDQIGIDGPVLWFALSAGLVTPLLFGTLPALQATQIDPQTVLKEGNRPGGNARRSSIRGVLIVASYALAVVLLVGGGLMIKTLIAFRTIDPGYDPDNVIALNVQKTVRTQKEYDSRSLTLHRIADRIRLLPEVHSVALADHVPLDGDGDNDYFQIAGQPPYSLGKEPVLEIRNVSPGYFATLRTPLLSGRDFTDRDNTDSPRVTIINQTMARRFWPHKNPIGERIGLTDGTWWQIVGVAGDVKTFGLHKPVRYEMHVPLAWTFAARIPPSGSNSETSIVVRTSAGSAITEAAIRQAVHEIDPRQPLTIKTFHQMIERYIVRPRFAASILTVFSCVALLLAAAGIYSLISYSVARRTNEIGIRVALGAASHDILGLVLGHGLKLSGAGVALGLILAALLARFMSAVLLVSPLDPIVYASVVFLLALTGMAATYIPARRAAAIDPMAALRYE